MWSHVFFVRRCFLGRTAGGAGHRRGRAKRPRVHHHSPTPRHPPDARVSTGVCMGVGCSPFSRDLFRVRFASVSRARLFLNTFFRVNGPKRTLGPPVKRRPRAGQGANPQAASHCDDQRNRELQAVHAERTRCPCRGAGTAWGGKHSTPKTVGNSPSGAAGLWPQ